MTGAVDGALAELGIAAWPYVAECDGADDDSDVADAAAEKRAWRSRVDRAMEPVVRDRIVRYLTFRRPDSWPRSWAPRQPWPSSKAYDSGCGGACSI